LATAYNPGRRRLALTVICLGEKEY
jgi:hypothetical protein